MNFADILILLTIAAAAFLALRIHRTNGGGCSCGITTSRNTASGGCSGCASCPHAAKCQSMQNHKKAS